MAPKRFEEYTQGSWDAKALIKDLKQSKTLLVNVSIAAVGDDKMRFEVITPLGMHIGSYALNGNKVQYVLTQQKRYYSGPSTEKSTEPILLMALDPKHIVSLLFDRVPKDRNWSCELDEQNMLKNCSFKPGQLTVEWSQRVSDRRTMTLKSPKAELQLFLKEFSSKVQDSPGFFSIEKPKGFSTIN